MDSAQPLYDLAPLARLMLLGVVIALGPLAWVWLRNRRSTPLKRLQALTVLTLFLTFDLVLFGAFTRLTDSGLGCPDWPGCYGNASPVGARAEISAAQAAMPTGPVTHGKAWVEMIHRYLATGVGVLIIVITASSWVQHRRARAAGGAAVREAPPISPWWPTFTLFWVCLQGAFGALTVTMKLFPAIVTLHLIGGLVLLALLCAQAVWHSHWAQGRQPVRIAPALRSGIVATAVLVGAQVVLGGWVSTNYAVLACTTFPTCQGSWWPAMDFSQGFQVWRQLGMLQDGSHISFAGLTAIHYVHRLMAYAVLAALLALVWRLRRAGVLRVQALWLLALTVAQLVTGLSNVVLGWPLVAAVLHTGGAAAMVMVLTWALVASRTAQSPQEISAPHGASRVSA
ncbi:COX15/CtaA family protein [Paracidovorax sp. MALMAid1276]|uniref:COX15/CtaA family protein n=1 Tax=Paracidovorax sp. MALMAid1276 TaxID=3411631 RepID=UPI003B9B577A